MNEKNNNILKIQPSAKKPKFLKLFSFLKCNNRNTSNITKMYAVGVCLERKAKRHKNGNINHNTLFFF